MEPLPTVRHARANHHGSAMTTVLDPQVHRPLQRLRTATIRMLLRWRVQVGAMQTVGTVVPLIATLGATRFCPHLPLPQVEQVLVRNKIARKESILLRLRRQAVQRRATPRLLLLATKRTRKKAALVLQRLRLLRLLRQLTVPRIKKIKPISAGLGLKLLQRRHTIRQLLRLAILTVALHSSELQLERATKVAMNRTRVDRVAIWLVVAASQAPLTGNTIRTATIPRTPVAVVRAVVVILEAVVVQRRSKIFSRCLCLLAVKRAQAA